jgi:DNA end-binding protein Ku
VTAKEIDMALRLVEDMSDQWQPEQYKDTYRQDLMARIEEKIKAGETREITRPEKAGKEAEGAEVVDLMALLKKSIEQKAKPAARRQPQGKRRAA